MKLVDGPKIAQRPAADGAPCLRVFLACAFPALHLRTFLTAYLREQRPEVGLEICGGFFGDLAGNAVGNEPEGPEEAADQASINFPPHLYAILEETAQKKKESFAWVVREAAEKYIEEKWPLLAIEGHSS